MDHKTSHWDAAAGDFQAVFRLGLNDYNASLLRFWHESGMLFPGARVIDIGCGVGKYGTYLAELGYDVTLTDISGKMLSLARENMAKYRTPWAVYQCDFGAVTGTEPVFAGGFDLAVSTMSPAVHDTETVKKMSAITHGRCFLARFHDWEQPFRDELMRRMGVVPRSLHGNAETDCASMIRAVGEAGFDPLVKTVSYNWADARTPEQMAEYLLRRYFSERERPGAYEKALCAAQDLADGNGLVTDSVNTKVAWIYWKT